MARWTAFDHVLSVSHQDNEDMQYGDQSQKCLRPELCFDCWANSNEGMSRGCRAKFALLMSQRTRLECLTHACATVSVWLWPASFRPRSMAGHTPVAACSDYGTKLLARLCAVPNPEAQCASRPIAPTREDASPDTSNIRLISLPDVAGREFGVRAEACAVAPIRRRRPPYGDRLLLTRDSNQAEVKNATTTRAREGPYPSVYEDRYRAMYKSNSIASWFLIHHQNTHLYTSYYLFKLCVLLWQSRPSSKI
jgi:hypothetical protein